jgi:hypothetical protein
MFNSCYLLISFLAPLFNYVFVSISSEYSECFSLYFYALLLCVVPIILFIIIFITRIEVRYYPEQHHLMCLSSKRNVTLQIVSRNKQITGMFIIIIIIININIKDWTLWSVPSPELQLFAPTLLRSSNCSPSLRSVVVWFQGDSVLWQFLQVCKPVPSVFIYPI